MAKKEVVTRGFRLGNRMRVGILILLILCVYGKTLKFGLVELDDRELIAENYTYIHDLSNISQAFTTDVFYNPTRINAGAQAYYRPMLTLSFMINAMLGGESIKIYHLFNIVFHIVSCLLLLTLLKKLKLNEDLAFLFALMFAVHPALSQAVAWIPGRNDSLLTIFVCAGFISLVNYFETGKTGQLFLHVLFFVFAIFTKETAISVPLLAILLVLFFYPAGRLKILLVMLSGYLAVLIPWFILRQQATVNSPADLSFAGLSHSLVQNLPLLLQYFQKSLLPAGLSILAVPKDTNYLIAIVLLLLIGLLLFQSKNKSVEKIIFGGVWFAAFLLPAFVVHMLTGFEHRVYLAIIGLMIVLSEVEYLKKFTLQKTTSALIGGGVVLVFLVVSFNHANSFSGNLEFWKAAALHSENSALARLNYGVALSQTGNPEEAEIMYKEGLQIDPKQPLLHNNLGTIYARKGKQKEAAEEFRKEIEINPAFSDAYFNLGLVYHLAGQDSLAIAPLEKTLRMNPGNVNAKSLLQQIKAKVKS